MHDNEYTHTPSPLLPSFPPGQVAPFLDELLSYTMLGPALRKRKVDVDHIVASTERMTVGQLMDQVNMKQGVWGDQSPHLSREEIERPKMPMSLLCAYAHTFRRNMRPRCFYFVSSFQAHISGVVG